MRPALLILVAILAGLASGQAKLTTPRAVFDFGKKPQAATFTGTFELVNSGDEPALVTKIDFQCACAKGRLDRRTIRPGEKATLTFDFETRDFEGTIAKNVKVHVGGLAGRPLGLEIRGEVVPAWRVEPKRIDLGAVKAGDVFERRVVVEVTEGRKVRMSFLPLSRGLKCTIDRTGAPREFVLALSTTAPTRPGPFAEVLDIRSTDAAKPSWKLVLMGHVEGDLRVAPRLVAFGRIKKKRVERRVVIESRAGRPFSIVNVRTDGRVFFDTALRKPATRHELVLSVEPGLKPGRLESRVIVQTDHHEERNVEIRCSGQVLAR